MSSTYSSSLKIELIGNGDQSGTWGQTTDNNWNLIEQAVTGVQSITMLDTDYTLTNLNGVSDEARNAVIIVTGTNSAIRNIITPSAQQKVYTIYNNTTGGFSINIKTASGTAISIPNGQTYIVYTDGTNFYTASSTQSITGTTNQVTAITNAGLTTIGLANPIVDPTIQGVFEPTSISATAATGTVVFYTLTQAALYYTTAAAANWGVNFTGNGVTTLNSLMATGQTFSTVFMVTQGATPYYNNAVYVDGSLVTPKWQGGSAPTSGNASGIDVYTYAIIKTGSAAFTVLASQSQFK